MAANADLPRQRRLGTRKAEHRKGGIEGTHDSFDPADTHHARSMVRQIKCKLLQNSAAGVWTRAILERRPVRLVTVALANKMARVAWALMTRNEVYYAKGRVAATAESVA